MVMRTWRHDGCPCPSRRHSSPFESNTAFAPGCVSYAIASRIWPSRNLISKAPHRRSRVEMTIGIDQSFMGAAMHDMVLVAKRRGETEAAAVWQKRLDILSGGIMKSLTTERDGQETYLEMRLPSSAAGVPYMGMGWVVLSPLAAGWIPDEKVLSNTVSALERTNLKTTHGQVWMPTDGYADGTFSNEIIGKGQASEMEYARTHAEWTRVTQILNLIKTVNTPSLYMEGAWLENSSYHLSERLGGVSKRRVPRHPAYPSISARLVER
jgi:hypothetical protein